jgi:hypothetical protein
MTATGTLTGTRMFLLESMTVILRITIFCFYAVHFLTIRVGVGYFLTAFQFLGHAVCYGADVVAGD